VRVTAPVALGRQHVAPHLLSFLRKYSDIQVELELSDRLSNLPQEGFDLAVRHVAAPPENHVAWKLCDTRSLLVASAAYLRRHGQPQHPAELAQHACLTYLRPGAAVWMFEQPDAKDAEPQRVRVTVQGPLRANTSEVLREAARAGLGIALAPDFSLDLGGRSSTLRAVLPQWRAVGFFGQAIYAIRPWSPNTPRASNCWSSTCGRRWQRGFDCWCLVVKMKVAADRTVRVARQVDGLEISVQCIDQQQLAAQGFAGLTEDFQRFNGLQLPTRPTKGASTPMVAHCTSSTGASGGNRQA
jgi:transcriptional regulator, LysR family